jgi:hypothetical protein
MSGHRPDYSALKNAHSEIDHEQVAQEREADAAAEAAAQEPSWAEKTDAKYDAKRQALQDKYAANRINSRELINETRKLDQQQVKEYEAKAREEAKARGETPHEQNNWDSREERGLGYSHDNIKDDRDR